jgi:hypothetical protein
MSLTGRFWFRKTWTGQLVLLVEEQKPRWLGRRGTFKLRWRDAKLLDLAAAPLRPLMDLERSRRSDYAPRVSSGQQVVTPLKPASPAPSGEVAA